MGNPNAFLNIKRKEAGYRPISDRIKDFSEVEQTLNSEDRRLQASRCMECGVPFCHWSCPLGNRPPEWQDLLYKNDIKGAYKLLSMTNDFPEFTGRVCPALCEKGCVLNKTHEPVTIRENEAAITEIAFNEGMVTPRIPKHRNGKRLLLSGLVLRVWLAPLALTNMVTMSPYMKKTSRLVVCCDSEYLISN